jgi:hypothetical protein
LSKEGQFVANVFGMMMIKSLTLVLGSKLRQSFRWLEYIHHFIAMLLVLHKKSCQRIWEKHISVTVVFFHKMLFLSYLYISQVQRDINQVIAKTSARHLHQMHAKSFES